MKNLIYILFFIPITSFGQDSLISGCTYSSMFNYNPNAVENDGSCIPFIYGCMEEWADNYDQFANTEDSTCAIFGCTEELADNYDSSSTENDGSCFKIGCTENWADNFDQHATQSDGSCFRLGCTQQWADNYDSLATSNIYFPDVTSLPPYIGATMNIIFTKEVIDFLPTANDSSIIFAINQHGNVVGHSEINTNISVYNVQNSSQSAATIFTVFGGDDFGDYEEMNYLLQGEEVSFVYLNGSNLYQIYIDPINANTEIIFQYNGMLIIDSYQSIALVDRELICSNLGCTEEWADNYDSFATEDDSSCYKNGCIEEWADNYDSLVTQHDSSCYKYGCVEEWADNFDELATQDDSSCYKEGCTQSWAANYDSLSTIDNSTCYQFGCTDSLYLEYNENYTIDDGSCLTLRIYGCIDTLASNYDSLANTDNGSCLIYGCTHEIASNYDSLAITDNNECEYLNHYSIPDSGFLAYLLDHYPFIIEEGLLNLSAANEISEMYIDDNQLSPSLYYNIHSYEGLEYFLNLEALYISSYTLTSFIVSGLNINTLYINAYSLNDVQITNSNINELYLGTDGLCYGLCHLQNLNLNNSIIDHLQIGGDSQCDEGCEAPPLTFGYPDSLQSLHLAFSDFQLDSIFSEFPDLSSLTILDNTNITFADFSALSNLNNVYLYGNDNLECVFYPDHLTEYIDIYGGVPSCDSESFSSCPYDIFLEYNPSYNFFDESLCLTLIVNGCTDNLAFNYDSLANLDDNSCEYIYGCTDDLAFNYDSLANLDDNSCEYIYGCTDDLAFNYDSLANLDDESCEYIYGCTSSIAENYIPEATYDDGSCVIFGCSDESAINYYENATEDDRSCMIEGCMNYTAVNYNENAYIDDGSCLIFGCTISLFPNYNPEATEADGSCDMSSSIIYGCTDSLDLNYNSDANYEDGSCNNSRCPGEVIILSGYVSSGGAIYNGTYGYSILDQNMTLLEDTYQVPMPQSYSLSDTFCLIPGCYHFNISGENISAQIYSATGQILELNNNFNSENWDNNLFNLSSSFCVGENYIYGCTNSLSYNFDPLANIDDGSCINIVEGCTDSLYTEYNALANSDDSSCATIVVEGCTDHFYLEYNLLANTEDGSCLTIAYWGCTDSLAFNYSSLALGDDGSCIDIVYGCTDLLYLEYNLLANTDDGSCLTIADWWGCTDSLAFNYNPLANIDDSSCISIDEDCQGEEVILSGSVEGGGAMFGDVGYSIYNEDTVLYEIYQPFDLEYGYNYISIPDTFCLIPGCYYFDVFGENINAQLYTDSIQILELQNDVNHDDVSTYDFNLSSSFCTGESYVLGCTDESATNFNPSATNDDDSCYHSIELGVLECGISTSTNLDTINGQYTSSYAPQAYSAYSFSIDSSTNVEFSYEMNVLSYNYLGFSQAQILLFRNGILINSWEKYNNPWNEYYQEEVPSNIWLEEGDYTLIYGNEGYDLYPNEEMNLEEATSLFSIFNNDNEDFSIQISLLQYDGSCVYEACPYTQYLEYHHNAINYDISLCTTFIIEGCTDTTAYYYNHTANVDDGSCEFIYGCTDQQANNYLDEATTDDGSCIYYGCTDTTAANYNQLSNVDDGSCLIGGCMNYTAENYNQLAEIDDGTCVIFGCTLNDFPNHNPLATIDDGSCDVTSTNIFGCTDSLAQLYNPSAQIDNGYCYHGLFLKGIMDFTVPSGIGKGIHLQANENILDLSIYGIQVLDYWNNISSPGYTFDSISVSAGDDILIIRSDSVMSEYFADCYGEFEVVLIADGHINQNGNEAIVLFEGDTVIDVFGEPGVDGDGQPWGYRDSWAYKVDGEWIYGGVNCSDGSETTATSHCPYPICGYGCTDNSALNHNSYATLDNGSCIFPTNLGVLECGVTLSTSLDTLSGNCNNNYDAPVYEVYSFTLDSTSTVEMSFDINAWECWCYDQNYVKVLLFENGYLLDWWEEYASSCGGGSSSNISSEIVLSAGDYQVVYGGNTSLSIYEGLAIQDAIDEFTLAHNPYDTVSVQMSFTQYDGTCDYLGCTDNNALNFNSLANLDDGSCINLTELGVLECGISTSTNLDTINGQYTSSYAPQAYSAYSFSIDSSTNVEFSYEMNVLSYNYLGFSQAQILLFRNGILINSWEKYNNPWNEYYQEEVPSNIWLEEGDYTLIYGNEGYDLYPNEEMNLEEATSLFSIFNNDNEDFSIQISLLQYDGTCDYLGCTDNNALNYNSDANSDDGSCNYPIDLGNLECGNTLVTDLDTINGSYANSINQMPQSITVYDFSLDNPSNVEILIDINVLSIIEQENSHIYFLLFKNGILINTWSERHNSWQVFNQEEVPSNIWLEEGDYTLMYGNYNYYMNIYSGMSLSEANFEFNHFNDFIPEQGDDNNTETCSIQISLLQHDGTCDYLGCTDNNALNYNSDANSDDGSCNYPIDLGSLECGHPLVTDLDIINGYYTNFDSQSAQHVFGYNFSLDSTSIIEMSIDMNSLSYSNDYNQALILFFKDEILINSWEEYHYYWDEFYQDDVPSNISLDEGDYTLLYGNNNYDMEIYSGMSLSEANSQFQIQKFNNNNNEFTIQISLLNYNGICDYNGCTDPNAYNYSSEANVDNGTCNYPFDMGELECGIPLTIEDTIMNGSIISQIISGYDAYSFYLESSTNVEISFEMNTLDDNIEGYSRAYILLFRNGNLINSWNPYTYYEDSEINNNLPSHIWLEEADYTLLYGNYNWQDIYNGMSLGQAISEFDSYISTSSDDFSVQISLTQYDGSCPYFGCTDDNYLEYNSLATIDNGSCTTTIVYGCTDEESVNYSPIAHVDDNSCRVSDCNGNHVWNLYYWSDYEEFPILAYADGVCHNDQNWGINLNCAEFNFDGGDCIPGCMDIDACNFNPEALSSDNSCVYPGEIEFIEYINSYFSQGTDVFSQGTSLFSQGTDVFSQGTSLFIQGSHLFSQGTSLFYNGFESLIETILNQIYSIFFDFDNDEVFDCAGCINDINNNDICDEFEVACPYPEFVEYSPAAPIYDFESCETFIIHGCTNPLAYNFNSLATVDDGSCTGCIDEQAFNYNPNITIANNTLCQYLGCLNPMAENYNNQANLDDGSCIIFGCTFEMYPNFNPEATIEDGSCSFVSNEIYGCIDSQALNYNIEATIDNGGCEYPIGCPIPFDWQYEITDVNHTIMIPANIIAEVNGQPLSIGSSVGVFYYNDNGELKCAGYTQLLGEQTYIAVMGDDSSTEQIDGFQEGENMIWMVWDILTCEEYQVNALSDDSLFYSTNGVSTLGSLNHFSCQEIILPGGWFMYSSYIETENMDAEILMDQIQDNLIIVKDNSGNVYLPEWSFNGIGEIDYHYGYQIKTNVIDVLELCGLQMYPEDHPIILSSGWNLIAYLRETAESLEYVLESIDFDNNIIIVKDFNGSPYFPEFSFNGIGDMKPGQGYQIKVNEESILIYPENE